MKLSVIIPVYNGAALVGAAIESVLSQRVERIEIIVVNDGSTDSTAQVLEGYKPLITVINRENGGVCAARNTAVVAARGEYLALLDADDIWLSGRLWRTLDALERNPKAVMGFCDYIPMDVSGNLLEPTCIGRAPTHRDLLKRGWSIVPSTVTIRRSALESVGGFCEEFKGCGGGEDHYMWLRLSEYGSFEYISEPLVVYRRASPAAIIRKYKPGLNTFARLVRQRYGRQASTRVRESKQYFAAVLLASGAAELAAGNFQCVLWMLLRAMRYRPFLLFNPGIARRLLRSRNLRRAAAILISPPRLS